MQVTINNQVLAYGMRLLEIKGHKIERLSLNFSFHYQELVGDTAQGNGMHSSSVSEHAQSFHSVKYCARSVPVCSLHHGSSDHSTFL